MSRKPDVPAAIRLTSLFMVFSIPSLYLPGFYPFFALPASAVALACAGYAVALSSARTLPALALSPLAIWALARALLAACSLFHVPSADEAFMRFAQSRALFTATCVFAFASSFLYLRFARWNRVEPLILVFMVVALFWSQGNHSLTLLDHPVKAAALATVFMALQAIALASRSGQSSKRILPLALLLPLACAVSFALVVAYNAKSVANDGGLIQPTMFRFDFSPYLSLQDEIKTNDRLVMIVKTKEEYASNFLRRVYLGGWDPDRGFYEKEAPGETPQVTKVPAEKRELPHIEYRDRQRVEQECFVVNFDPSSLVAMDYPVSIQPWRLWNQSSFTGAYSVASESPLFIPFELFESAEPEPSDFTSFYTYVDGQNLARLRPLALEVTSGITGYYDRVVALSEFLHDGDYRYSLRPGVATDGDRLGSFLFKTKKGYCTYFAFSLCLMLRSIGIPSRVAAGFFLRPDSAALDNYPVRSNMAHAWVEAFFPEYGWISFDPTTTLVAEGENIELSDNPGGEDFMRLVGEIVDNKNLVVRAQAMTDAETKGSTLSRAFRAIIAALDEHTFAILAALASLCLSLAAFVRIVLPRLSRNPRKKTLFLYSRMIRAIKLSPARTRTRETREQVLALGGDDAATLYDLAQKARFSAEFGDADAELAERAWRAVRKSRPRSFRFLACAFAFLMACAASSPARADSPDGAAHGGETAGRSVAGNAAPDSATLSATALLARAKNAVVAENWEVAITVLSEGIRVYPDNPDFHQVLGKVYFGQGIYESAYKELSAARDLGSDDIGLYSALSDTLSCLNRDSEAIDCLSAYLARKDDDLYAWSNYGWLCYKTHRLETGITALQAVIERYGPDGNVYVGLGNLYTAAFKYPEAEKYYTLAIEIAEEEGQKYLASVYYYNRSILEKTFFRFDEAYRDTERSIERAPRSSGYLMQSELELKKLDFGKALGLYAKALALDSTPLATIGLADTYLKMGDPERALAYISALKKKTDRSWIANYGTTTDQYEADCNMLLHDYYRLLINKEKRTVIHGLSTKVSSWFRCLSWSLSVWYHDSLFRINNTDIAKHFSRTDESPDFKTEQRLYTSSFYFLAFNTWKSTAEPYLREAESIEVSYIPKLQPSFLYERGELDGDVNLLDSAISTLNPVWEREILVKSLAARLKLTKKADKAISSRYSSTLFDLNPAAFIYYGLALPVRISKDLPTWTRTMLRHSGFTDNELSPYAVEAVDTQTGLTIILVDRNRNVTLYTQDVNKIHPSQTEKAQFINKFSTSVFTPRLN